MSVPPLEQRLVKLAVGTYDRLAVLKDELKTAKNRQVTFDEAVEYLLDYRETKDAIEEEVGRR